jgi:hypothetical protein
MVVVLAVLALAALPAVLAAAGPSPEAAVECRPSPPRCPIYNACVAFVGGQIIIGCGPPIVSVGRA